MRRAAACALSLLALLCTSTVQGQYDATVQSTVGTLSSAEGDSIGWCVAAVGSRFLYATAPGQDGGAIDSGRAYVRPMATSGTASTYVSHDDMAGDDFGVVCSASAGGWAWACTSTFDLDSGKCWYLDLGVQTTSVPSTHTGSFLAPESEFTAEFGYDVSVSDDGEWVLIGAPGSDGLGSLTQPGALHIMSRSGDVWSQVFYVLGENTFDRLGEAVSIWSYPNSAIAEEKDLKKRPRVAAAASRAGKYVTVWTQSSSDKADWEVRATIGGSGEGAAWATSLVAVEDKIYIGDPTAEGKVEVHIWDKDAYRQPIIIRATGLDLGASPGFGSVMSVGDTVAGGRFLTVGAPLGTFEDCEACGFVESFYIEENQAFSVGSLSASGTSSDFGRSVDVTLDLESASDGRYSGYMLVGFPGYNQEFIDGGAYIVYELKVPTAFAGPESTGLLVTFVILGVGAFSGLVVGAFWLKTRRDVAAVALATSPSASSKTEESEMALGKGAGAGAAAGGGGGGRAAALAKRESQGGISDATSIPESFGTVAQYQSDATAFSQATDATRPGPAGVELGAGLPRRKTKSGKSSGKRKGSGVSNTSKNSRGSRRKGSGSRRKNSGSRRNRGMEPPPAPDADAESVATGAAAQGTPGQANSMGDVNTVPMKKFLDDDEISYDLQSIASKQAPHLPDMIDINDMSEATESIMARPHH